ncbi:MAG: hypothetical protein OXJ53_08520 [Gammaproteobacteria bacterium]|nr:hypothetical protein [Gammaproteobacteria bacterium]MDD9961398.1 hypothetical protein [Gammaproteobacteria bacterium]MDE0271375.1 hypothetical protein [Gammaproteobacteria bacterium]
MTLLQSVGEQVDGRLVVRRCSKQGCKVPLQDSPQPRLVLDLDRPGSPLGKNETRCDYLIIGEHSSQTGWAVALELKRGKVHADVANQLQAGADLTDALVPKEANIDFTPVVAGRGFHSNVKKTLANRKIQFRQGETPVVLMSCGKPLANAVGF